MPAAAAALVGGLLLGGCGRAAPSGAEVPPAASSLLANQQIVQALTPYPGATFEGQNDLGPPRGGRGAMSHLYYQVEGAARHAIVDHFKAQLSDWKLVKDEEYPVRVTATFVRGDAYLQISAMDVTSGRTATEPVPGYVLLVDAADAGVLSPAA